jgi:hypothetical protein
LLDEGATNISLNYSDLAAFFLAGFARGAAGAFAFAGALAGVFLVVVFSTFEELALASSCLSRRKPFRAIIKSPYSN